MQNIGVTLDTTTELLPAQEVIAIVQRIEELGFESVWLTDTMGREPFVLATALLANTRRIRVGTGIASMYGRDAMAAQQTRQTLSEMYPDRFLLGLGVSAPFANEMRKAHLMPPAKKLSSYLDDLHSFHIMSAPPEAMAPVYVAAHGPQLQQIAKEKADGILTWVMPAQHTEVTRARVGTDTEISCHTPFILSDDADVARSCARDYLSVWLSLPWYCKSWAAAGFNDADFADGGSDALIDSIVAWGDAKAIGDRLEGRFQAGASRLILQPLRKTREGEAGDELHQADIAPDWQALELIAKGLLG